MTRLRELIEEKNMMQKDVAADLGYPAQTLGNYVRGDRELDHEGICRVCEYSHGVCHAVQLLNLEFA